MDIASNTDIEYMNGQWPYANIEHTAIRIELKDTNMPVKHMILPSSNFDKIRLISIPDDYEIHEAYRKVTGLIAKIEEDNPDYNWDDILVELEDCGFCQEDYQLGPILD